VSSEYIKQVISENIFSAYMLDEVLKRNSVDFHAMTAEHTEVLGQFLDFSALSVEQLKECLVSGYLSMDWSKFIKEESLNE